MTMILNIQCKLRRNDHLSTLQELAYAATAGDEVEDLVALLAYAKQQQPEIQAVASGAIASDYQRTRVEHVRALPLQMDCNFTCTCFISPGCSNVAHQDRACRASILSLQLRPKY